MLSLLAALVLAPPPIDQPARLRTILANGSVVLVEPHFEARSITIDLFASSRGAEDAPKTHGWRHLLEHLLVRGRKGDVDARLEAVGGFLRAETLRDATAIELEVPPDQLERGLEMVAEMLHYPEVTTESIKNEIPILREELAIESDSARLANAGWNANYGELGLDPQGDVARIAEATPEAISDLYIRHFRAPNLVLVISGPIDLDGGSKLGTELMSRLPGSPVRLKGEQRIAHPLAKYDAVAPGSAITIPVGPYDSRGTAAILAVSLAFASEHPGCFVTYTPSTQAGLITVGTSTNRDLPALAITAGADTLEALYDRGRRLAQGWLRRQMVDPRSATFLRGLLLVQNANATPEKLEEAIQRFTFDDYRTGIDAIKQGTVVRGNR